jgi:hypothetical protein
MATSSESVREVWKHKKLFYVYAVFFSFPSKSGELLWLFLSTKLLTRLKLNLISSLFAWWWNGAYLDLQDNMRCDMNCFPMLIAVCLCCAGGAEGLQDYGFLIQSHRQERPLLPPWRQREKVSSSSSSSYSLLIFIIVFLIFCFYFPKEIKMLFSLCV